MSDQLARHHGPEAFFSMAESTPGAGVEIAVPENRGFLNLRLDPRREQAIKAAEGVLGQDLPLVGKRRTPLTRRDQSSTSQRPAFVEPSRCIRPALRSRSRWYFTPSGVMPSSAARDSRVAAESIRKISINFSWVV